jgi:PAS domain S-box-containing protein
MENARVLVVGTPADCTVDSGERPLDVSYEREPRAALDRLAEGFDYVVCVDLPCSQVAAIESVFECPVLDRMSEGDRPLGERVAALVDTLRTDGGVGWQADHPSEAVRQRAMDAAPVGVTIADAGERDCPLVYVNEGFERLTGYTAAEVLGRNCRFLQGEETDPAAAETFRRAIEGSEHRVVELLNYRKDGTPFWNRVELAPVEDETGTVTHFVGFQMDVTARREAEAGVERERANLETLLNRVNGLLGDVTAALMEASTRGAVERALVERLAGTDGYRGVWIGCPDLGADRFETAERVGVDDPPTVALSGADPVSRAYETGTAVFAADPPAHEGHHDGGVAAVPLTYRGTTYGVCCVYANDEGSFGEHERAVLRVLGRTAATAIHAIEGRRLLGSDTVTEVELRLPGTFPAGLAERLGATLTYEGAVFGDDHLRTFYTATRADPSVVTVEAAREPSVVGCRAVTDGPESLFEFAVTPDSLVPALADRGAELEAATADGDGVHVTLALPVSAETRSLVETLRDRFGVVELVATHERKRPSRTTPEFRDELESRLTDRQLTALRLAHVGGYFAPNRRASGEELAAAMGVSRSTFHQHLRAAQRKLADGFLDPGDGT